MSEQSGTTTILDQKFTLSERMANSYHEDRGIYNSNDFEASIQRVNYDLEQLGFPGIPSDSSNLDSLQVIKTIYGLLGQFQVHNNYKLEFEERYRGVSSDLDLATAAKDRLKNKVESLSNEIASLKLMERATQKEMAIKNDRHNQISDELRQLRTNHKANKNQFEHDLRKREVEANKCKEKAQKVINDKYKVQKIGVNMINPPPKSKLGIIDPAQAEDYYTKLVGQYADREAILVTEHLRLKTHLTDLFDGIRNWIKINSLNDKNPIKPLSQLNLDPQGDKLHIDNAINNLLVSLSALTTHYDELAQIPIHPEYSEMSTQTLPMNPESEVMPIIKSEPEPETELFRLRADQLAKELEFKVKEVSDQKLRLAELKADLEGQKKVVDSIQKEKIQFQQLFEEHKIQTEQLENDRKLLMELEAQEKERSLQTDRTKLDVEESHQQIEKAWAEIDHDKIEMDQERKELDQEREELDQDRDAISSTARELQLEKEALELERVKLEDLRRSISIAQNAVKSPNPVTPLSPPHSLKGLNLKGKSTSMPESTNPKSRNRSISTPDNGLKSPPPPRTRTQSSLMKPTASQILRVQATQVQHSNKLREAQRRHVLSPTPCSKPNCSVHKKILEQQAQIKAEHSKNVDKTKPKPNSKSTIKTNSNH